MREAARILPLTMISGFAAARPLDTERLLAAAKVPYPHSLREALIRRFQWEILFGIENAELAVARADRTDVTGLLYRSLACITQVLFALNERYLFNEKGALQETALLPLTIPDLVKQANEVWRLIGGGALSPACDLMRTIDRQLKALTRHDLTQQ